MEAEELNPGGQITTVMRRIGNDGRDRGVVNGRNMNFKKRSASSQIRITWATNLRARNRNNNGGAHCDWEVQIDNRSCSKPSKIGVSMHSMLNDNDHIPAEVVGWCSNIGAGSHSLRVYVTNHGGHSDCYTGWESHDFMEVWEPTAQEQSMITYMQRVGTDNGSDSSNNLLATSFVKKSSSSNVRILYYDNLRVYRGGWCRWEVRVDGKSCPAPLAGSIHTQNNDNDHYPATIVGECPGLKAGKRNINIWVRRSSGSVDCHTGWTPGLRVMHALIEVRESRPSSGAKLTVARLTVKNNSDGRDAASALPRRTLKFQKNLANSLMKLTYADNLRVYGNGKVCYWNIKVDNRNCPINIVNAKHTTATSDNDHTPHAIVGTCKGIKAGTHTMTIGLTRNGGADCYTGWSASGARDAFFMEAEELNPGGQITTVMRRIGNDGRDRGVVNGRNMNFKKRSASSQIRITWATNLRARNRNNNGGAHCDWEVQIDNRSCSKPSKIGVSMHSMLNDNDHIPAEVVGWCSNIGAGSHSLRVYVTNHGGHSDCYTGWESHDFMEVWEPTAQEQSMITYMQRVGTDNGSDSSNNLLATSFVKKSSSSNVRILYYDNLRVYRGGWCRWEVRVDGKSCPAPLAGSIHTQNNDNDHYPATIVGECPGLKAGKRNINIWVRRSSGSVDCHTGWTPGLRVMHALIEVQEM